LKIESNLLHEVTNNQTSIKSSDNNKNLR